MKMRWYCVKTQEITLVQYLVEELAEEMELLTDSVTHADISMVKIILHIN